MRDAIERAARAAEKAGARIRDLDLPPIFEEAHRAFGVIQGYEAFRALGFEYDGHRDRLGPILRRQLDDAAAIDADAYDDARRTTRRARRALLDLLPDGEAMLTPSAPGAAPLDRFARRAHLQPAVDAAGNALRQRPRTCRRRRACRSACRSSRASGATGSHSPPRPSSSRRSAGAPRRTGKTPRQSARPLSRCPKPQRAGVGQARRGRNAANPPLTLWPATYSLVFPGHGKVFIVIPRVASMDFRSNFYALSAVIVPMILLRNIMMLAMDA